VPIFANPASYENTDRRHIWLNESSFVSALDGYSYMVYYESFRAEAAYTSNNVDNMRREGAAGLAAAVHVYLHEMGEDQTPHIAAFLIGREEHW